MEAHGRPEKSSKEKKPVNLCERSQMSLKHGTHYSLLEFHGCALDALHTMGSNMLKGCSYPRSILRLPVST